MKLIWHIFKKDFFGQYLTFLLCILCGTYVGVMTRQGGNGTVVQDWLLIVAGISFYAFFFIMVVEVVQEDSLIDSTAFWQTRPISSGRLLAAKGMFILGLLVVKFLASLAVWLFLSNPDHKAFGNWDVWLGMLSFALLSGGLAACTRNLGKCFLGLVICLIFFLVASALADRWFRPIALSHMHQTAADIIAQHKNTWPFRHSPEQRPVPTRISSSVVVQIIISVAGLAAMLIQYFTRRTAVTMSLLFIAVLGAAAGSTYWKWNAPLWAVAPPASSGAKLDSQVKSILTGAAKLYADAQSFEADIDSVTCFKPALRNRVIDSPFHVAFQRPNLFSIVGNGGVLGGTMVSNGKTLITYRPASKKYTSADAPADLSELLSPRHLIDVDGSLLPLGYEDFLQKDPILNFEDSLLESEYVGSEKITDLPAQHVRLTYKNLVADYWIADGPQPLLLRAQFAHDLSGAMKNMSDDQKKNLPPGKESAGIVQISTYSNWRITQPVAVETFEFQPPPGVKLVTEFYPRTPRVTPSTPAKGP
jgi:outer membrane lipoprotein-sorting protein